MIKIIGIDPGLASTGIGIIKGENTKVEAFAYGSINTSKEDNAAYRLDHIFSELSELLKEEKPDMLAIEDVFSLDRYPKSGILLGEVTGVILLSGSRANIPITQIAVREAKSIITGNGNASKKQFEESIRYILKSPSKISPDHASDALGLALIGLYRYNKRT